MCDDEPMPEPPSAGSATSALSTRLEALGRSLGDREAGHVEALDRARAQATRLRDEVIAGVASFHDAVSAAGAPHLRIEVGPIRLDDKHLRAIEFELMRGRHRAIVVVKSRGEVTLVGPFRTGKNEGPCQSFPVDADAEIVSALALFLERFLEEAATP